MNDAAAQAIDALIAGGENNEDALRVVQRRDPQAFAAHVVSKAATFDIPTRAWLGRFLAEDFPGPARQAAVVLWAHALHARRAALPPLPPWPLAGRSSKRDEELFFLSTVQTVSDLWKADEIAAFLPDLLTHSDPKLRAAAASIAASWHGRNKPDYPGPVKGGLLSALVDPHSAVQEEAAWALSLTKSAAAVPLLRRMVQAPEGATRAAALAALCPLWRSEPTVGPLVMSALVDPHPWVRAVALTRLASYAPEPSTLREARRMQADPDAWVRSLADGEVRRLEGIVGGSP